MCCTCRDNKGGLTKSEIWDLTEGNRNIMDPTGWVAEKLEWFVSYYLFADDDVSASAQSFGSFFVFFLLDFADTPPHFTLLLAVGDKGAKQPLFSCKS